MCLVLLVNFSEQPVEVRVWCKYFILYSGEKLDHPNIRLVLSPGNVRKMKDIEDSCEVHIEKNVQKGFVIIYGASDHVNRAITKINT